MNKNNCHSRLFAEFIQTQKRYPTSLDKVSIPYLKIICQFFLWTKLLENLFLAKCLICGALAIWYHLYNLENLKNTHGGVLVLVKLQAEPATLLKLTLFRGCFSRFLNCTNGNKSCNASHICPCSSNLQKTSTAPPLGHVKNIYMDLFSLLQDLKQPKLTEQPTSMHWLYFANGDDNTISGHLKNIFHFYNPYINQTC